MTSPPRTLAVLALALAVAAAAPSRAAAQSSKADVFAGRIPPVSGQLFRKAGRFELTASGDLSLNDPFFRKYFGGLELGYHVTESWSLSLRGAGGLVTRSGSAVTCTASAGCVDASETMLRQVPGRIRGIAALGVAWAPVYGKLNVLAEKVGHFDLAVLVGADLVAHDQILSRADAEQRAVQGGDPSLKMAPGFHVGLGARFFLSEMMALRVEIKDLVYAAEVPNAGAGKDWQNQLFTEIGLSIFLPTRNRP